MSESRGPYAVEPGIVACTYCHSTDTELMSLFGQFLLCTQYYCKACHSAFEVVRWTEAAPDEYTEG